MNGQPAFYALVYDWIHKAESRWNMAAAWNYCRESVSSLWLLVHTSANFCLSHLKTYSVHLYNVHFSLHCRVGK